MQCKGVNRKALALILCVCIVMSGFTACKDREIDYNTEEIEIGNEGEKEKGAASVNGIPTHIEDSLTGGGGTNKIDADVLNIESYGRIPVAVLNIKDWSEQDVRSYAEGIFDKGSAEVILPFGRRSHEDLLDEKTAVETQIKELGYTRETINTNPEYRFLGYKLIEILYYLEHFNEDNVLENDGSYQWVSTKQTDDENTYEELSCQVKGTVAGREYGLRVQKGGADSSNAMTLHLTGGEYYAEENIGYWQGNVQALSPDSPIYRDNMCTLSEQEAVNQAEDFVSRLGIQGFAVSGAYSALRYFYKYDEEGNVGAEEAADGYLVYFGREMEGLTTPCADQYLERNCIDAIVKTSGSSGTEEESYSIKSTYGYEGITILITDNGVEVFEYRNPMEISEITTEEAELMDFNRVYENAKEYIQNEYFIAKIDTIRLCIGRVRYDDSYALIPVWCFEGGSDISDIYRYRTAVLVNAMDGSVIDIGSGRPAAEN